MSGKKKLAQKDTPRRERAIAEAGLRKHSYAMDRRSPRSQHTGLGELSVGLRGQLLPVLSPAELLHYTLLAGRTLHQIPLATLTSSGHGARLLAQLGYRTVELSISPAALGSALLYTKVQCFDGKGSWQAFLAQFNLIAEAAGWSWQERGINLAASLEGEAL
ncbi:hypothetical protein SKAU_G00197750 [Synaphobranchus kaupii]|uniref:Uncharacterized protein n=1 Tax=Synaphobranchus kaupii TaxID=118154 RepID=A0A9Q1IXJ1_SYNKA|nr:hypothetical protein SKAU_G00197750 [Synaphobranchus kaupii]